MFEEYFSSEKSIGNVEKKWKGRNRIFFSSNICLFRVKEFGLEIVYSEYPFIELISLFAPTSLLYTQENSIFDITVFVRRNNIYSLLRRRHGFHGLEKKMEEE